MKIGRDAEHGRGLMNEAVKIGSYEDDDYHVSSILHHVSGILYPGIPAQACHLGSWNLVLGVFLLLLVFMGFLIF